MKATTVAVIFLTLLLVDSFASGEAQFIQSYNAALRDHGLHVRTNPKGNGYVLAAEEVVGHKNMAGAHDIGKKEKGPSHNINYKQNTRKKKDGAMAFHLMGHSPGIGHNDPPGL